MLFGFVHLTLWCVVRYTGGTFRRWLLLFLCNISSGHGMLFPWDIAHMVHWRWTLPLSHRDVWVWTRQGNLSTISDKLQWLTQGSVHGSTLRQSDPWWGFSLELLEKTISFYWSYWESWVSSGHLVYCVERSHARDRQRESWRHHLRPCVQLWLQKNKAYWKKDRKNKSAHQS